MRPRETLFFVGLFLIPVAAGRGQTTVFIQEKVAVSRALAGYADIGITKRPAEGITVALCAPGWGAVLATTQTDAQGYFFLKTPTAGPLFFVRLSAPGVNPYQLRVRIKKNAPSELRIHLSNAA
jgi:hypothetical protein